MSADVASPGAGASTTARQSFTLSDLLVTAASIGLSAGFLEALILLFKREVLQQFIWTGTSVLWMAPASYAFLLTLLALVTCVVYAWYRRPIVFWSAIALFIYLVIDSLLLAAAGKGLHGAARVVLAAGATVQLIRIARAHSHGFRSLMRRSAPALLVLTLVCALSFVSWPTIAEKRSVKALPQAAADAPNVLVIVLDAVRAASMSLYGYDQPTTPRLAQFARRGVVFERAIAPASWTLPSHAAMFTGFWPHELQVGWMLPLKENFPTLGEAFLAQGYVTGAFTANFYYTTRETGLDRGFLRFDDSAKSFRQLVLGSMLGQRLDEFLLGEPIPERRSDRKEPADVSNAFLNWAGRRGDRPFFAFLNYFEAHKPYLSTPEFQARFAGAEGQRRYAASIAFLDEEVGKLLAELEGKDQLANTLVIITSDHGELMGEHGRRGHGMNLYLRALQVPLIAVWPGHLPAGLRVQQPVSLREIAATVADLAGLRKTDFPGNSLTRFWRTAGNTGGSPALSMVRPATRTLTPEGGPALYSLVDDSLHYIRNADGTEELYRYLADPTESTNVANSPELNAVLEGFRATLRGMGVSDLSGQRAGSRQ